MSASPPPAPTHLLRSHVSPVSALAFSSNNERLYSGDASGRVVVTSTRSLRAIATWNAHTDGILGVEEWGQLVITHGRDNKLHVWTRIDELPPSARLGGSAAVLDLPIPSLCYSMDVNALNYCRFSLTRLYDSKSEDPEPRTLIALPNLIDSSVADIWEFPSRDRLHASIGQELRKSIFSSEPGGRNNSGIIMSLHLFSTPIEYAGSSSALRDTELRLLCGYENGSVTLRKYAQPEKEKSVEGIGWEVIWSIKLHVESVMAMGVSRGNTLALTVSADNLIGRYDLSRAPDSLEPVGMVFKTKHAGNGVIAIRDDGRVCAIGGWDGRIRLYSTRTLKSLGTLKYHKIACQAVEFARQSDAETEFGPEDGNGADEDEEDEEMTLKEKVERTRWLVAGSKDNRVSIWSLISFEKK